MPKLRLRNAEKLFIFFKECISRIADFQVFCGLAISGTKKISDAHLCQFYIESSPVCNIVALKQAILTLKNCWRILIHVYE
jgi:hypothetical protein